MLRVTDHKTGKNRSNAGSDRRRRRRAAAGALQRRGRAGAGQKVVEGRLFYCTTAGGFAEHADSRSTTTRAARGCRCSRSSTARSSRDSSSAAPAERACTWCDFRPVCGPREEERVARKAKDRLADLAGAEVDAMTRHRLPPAATPTRVARSPTTSTTRSSSKRRPAPARRPSWSTGSCACSRPGRATMDGDRRGHLHREGGGRAEAAAARSARAASARRRRTTAVRDAARRRRSRRSKKRTSTRSTASAPTCCASGRSKRASIRCSPC